MVNKPLTDKERAIVTAALTELKLQLDRGVANSDLHEATLELLSRQRRRLEGFHESDVDVLLNKLRDGKI